MHTSISFTRRNVLRTAASGAFLGPAFIARVDGVEASATYRTPLIAARSVTVGQLAIALGSTTVAVTFDTRGTAWTIDRTHLHVADALEAIPATQSGNPVVGRFEFADTPVTNEGQLAIYPAIPRPEGDRIVIAAHAEVRSGDRRETAWGDGLPFVESGRGSWATYVVIQAGACIVLALDRIEQYQQLQHVDLPDPFELQIDAVDVGDRPIDGTFGVELGVTNHHGSLDDPPTSRAFTVLEDLAFVDGTAGVTIASHGAEAEVDLRMPCTVGDLCDVAHIETVEVELPTGYRLTELRVCGVG